MLIAFDSLECFIKNTGYMETLTNDDGNTQMKYSSIAEYLIKYIEISEDAILDEREENMQSLIKHLEGIWRGEDQEDQFSIVMEVFV